MRFATKGGVAAHDSARLVSPNRERTGQRRRGLLSAGRQRSIRLCFCPALQPVAHLRYRVNPIVGAFKPERSQSPEKRLKSTLVLAALQHAPRTEATTSSPDSTSLDVAQSDSLGIAEQDDASDGAVDVRADDGVIAIAPSLAREDALSKRKAATKHQPAADLR